MWYIKRIKCRQRQKIGEAGVKIERDKLDSKFF